MKKAWILLLCAALVWTLASCQGGPDILPPDQVSPVSGPDTAPGAVPETMEDPQADPNELVIPTKAPGGAINGLLNWDLA